MDSGPGQDLKAFTNACALLGVSPPKAPGLPFEEQKRLLQEWKDTTLKAAWRAAARKHHPDTGGSKVDFEAAKAAHDLLLSVEYAPPKKRIRIADMIDVEISAEDEQLGREIRDEFMRQATEAIRRSAREASVEFEDVIDTQAEHLANDARKAVRDTVFSYIGDIFGVKRRSKAKKKPAKGRRTTTIG